MDCATLSAEIKEIVVSSLGLPVKPEMITDDEVLYGGRFNISSMAVIDILTEIEGRLGVEVPDEVLDIRIFDSIRTLVETISSLLQKADAVAVQG